MNDTGHLARCAHPWQAKNIVKQLAGMVAHELIDGVETPFEPRVEYDERFEPNPWVVV